MLIIQGNILILIFIVWDIDVSWDEWYFDFIGNVVFGINMKIIGF